MHAKQIPSAVKKLTKLAVNSVEAAGEARHVFTHQIWQMKLCTMRAAECAEAPAGYRFVPVDELDALAIPTAVKASVRAVREYHGGLY